MDSLRKATLKTGKVVARLAVNIAKQVGAIEEGLLPLTEENLRVLNSLNEPLGFMDDDLVCPRSAGHYRHDTPIQDSKNDLDILGFTDDDLINFSDIPSDGDDGGNWSLVAFPGSRQFSDWISINDKDAVDDAVEEGIEQDAIGEGVAQVKEVIGIARAFLGRMV